MSKLFLGGVPTDLDVRKLEKAFGQPDEGSEISHEEVEGAIGLQRDASRYRTVTQAWRRKLLKDHNCELGAISGVGFRCLTSPERISAAIDGVKQGGRKTMRSVRRSDRVSTDDPLLQKKQEVLRRFATAVQQEATTAMRQIEPPKPQQQMPRLVPRQQVAG